MKDELYYNIYTGEVLPATAAIKQFYEEEKHNALDRWTDEWTFTGLYSDDKISAPDFTKVF